MGYINMISPFLLLKSEQATLKTADSSILLKEINQVYGTFKFVSFKL